MNRHVYNVALALGVILVSVGAGMVYIPAGVITAGAMVLGLTLLGAVLSRGDR